MASITITISDLPHAHVSVCTNADKPVVGRSVTPAEALAMELLGTSFKRGAHVVYDAAQVPALALAMDLINPEVFGWVVPLEIARQARQAIGRELPNTAGSNDQPLSAEAIEDIRAHFTSLYANGAKGFKVGPL